MELLHLPSRVFEQEKTSLLSCIGVGLDQRLSDIASRPDELTGWQEE